jgi:hypothetical protein
MISECALVFSLEPEELGRSSISARRVPFHQLVNILLIVFKLSAGLAKHLAVP